jgi:hypothetical protein
MAVNPHKTQLNDALIAFEGILASGILQMQCTSTLRDSLNGESVSRRKAFQSTGRNRPHLPKNSGISRSIKAMLDTQIQSTKNLFKLASGNPLILK